jgi:G3E family GTPase
MKIPVTVLTGYLGAGKRPHSLNRILTERHGKRYAVIVNEYASEGIDAELIVNADEEVVEMNNGCLCCTVRGDLIRILHKLLVERGEVFDGILIETTGLANPAPVAQIFFLDDDLSDRMALDAVVTVIDAKHAGGQLQLSPEIVDQIAFADVIVVNKIDLVSTAELEALEATLRSINRSARLHRTQKCAIDVDAILGCGAFSLDRVTLNEPEPLYDHAQHHHHRSDIVSVVLRAAEDIDSNEFMLYVQRLLRHYGQDLLRSKGILSFVDARTENFWSGSGIHFRVLSEICNYGIDIMLIERIDEPIQHGHVDRGALLAGRAPAR